MYTRYCGVWLYGILYVGVINYCTSINPSKIHQILPMVYIILPMVLVDNSVDNSVLLVDNSAYQLHKSCIIGICYSNDHAYSENL